MRTGSGKAVFAMAGIFLAGAVAGAVGGVAWSKHNATRMDAQEFVDRQLKRRVDQLELSSEQIARIKPIMKQHEETIRVTRRKCFHEIGQVFRNMNVEIEGALTADQREKFRLIQEKERQHFEKQIQSRSRHKDSDGKHDEDRKSKDGEKGSEKARDEKRD
ncbi:MAG: hypothetical protein ACREIA_18110 [Opitutaceae bacterium]